MLALGSGYSSHRDAVRALQRRLARAGDAPGPIDGRYGPRTEQAVIRFQATHGLLVDGIAGPLTWAALSGSAPVLEPGAGYAGRGSPAVRVLQHRLTRAGYAPGPIDGRYGPRTERAVIRFQATHGLLVDGIAGPQTVGRLVSERKPHIMARLSLLENSRQRAGHNWQSHRRAHTTSPEARALPRSTSSPAPALVTLLVALVACGLWATWLARGRRNKQYAAAQTKEAKHPDPGDPAVGFPADDSHAAARNQPRAAGELDPAGPQRAERMFKHALALEELGDPTAAATLYRRADQLGHDAAACNLGVLLHEQGDWTAAEAWFRRAVQRRDPYGAFNLAVCLEEHGAEIEALNAYERAAQLGDPETAEMVYAAADDLRQRIDRSTVVGKGGGLSGS
jgi:peptidoglycan hydrolase-like protein with peptidoglycan-binding domain/Tfp pilus assembly protein PilF